MLSHLQGGSSDGCDIRLELPADGYVAAAPEPQPAAVLRADILAIFGAVRFWEKDSDWLRVRPHLLSTAFNHNQRVAAITSSFGMSADSLASVLDWRE